MMRAQQRGYMSAETTPPGMQALHNFVGTNDAMQRTIAVLCESNHKSQADVVTQVVTTMLNSPMHIQLTAAGLQPFKGRELTFPYARMSVEQRQALKHLIDEHPGQWLSYEHAMIFKSFAAPPPKQLAVLEALCNSVMASEQYADKRLRLAICNILLQRVQASVPIERSVQSALNERLLPVVAPPSKT